MASIINVTELIDQHGVSKFQMRAVFLCTLIMTIDGFDAQALSFTAPAIAPAWHVARSAFGPVFSAGLLGLALGGLLFGLLADRFGRRRTTIFCAFYIGAFTLAKATTGSLQSLEILQFLGGLGMGGIFPNAIALTSEYSPKTSRATMVGITMCGYSIGSGFGGFVAAYLLSTFGWRSVFVFAGALPLVIALVLIAALPETPSYMVVKKRARTEIAAIVRRIVPNAQIPVNASFAVNEEHRKGIPVGHLFKEGRALRTVLLWIAVWMDLMVVYFMISWLPMLAHQRGFSLEKAVVAGSMFSVAGIFGALTVGRFMDRFGVHRMLALAFAVAGAFTALIGTVGGSYAVFMFVIFLAGFCVVGGHAGINAFASHLYPTYIRSTGIGWALGIGRIGSLISPMIGGLFIAWHWKLSSMFFAVAVPAVIAAVTILLIGTLASASEPEAIATATRAAEAIEA